MALPARLKHSVRDALLGVQRRVCKEVLVVGDSHAAIFGHKLIRLRLWRYHFNVVSVGGATASGLENPNSKTQAFQKFDRALATTRAEKVIVMLGEVDTGFVIWYRADKYDISVQDAFEKTLRTYQQFLGDIKARGLSPICVSTPLPTIQDDNDWGEIANERKAVSTSQRERTELTLAFNREMEAFCRTENIAYINLDGSSLGADGLVKEKLLNRNPSDHHYEKRVFATMLSKPVSRTVKSKPRAGSAPGFGKSSTPASSSFRTPHNR
jgi:hypothetical protein